MSKKIIDDIQKEAIEKIGKVGGLGIITESDILSLFSSSWHYSHYWVELDLTEVEKISKANGFEKEAIDDRVMIAVLKYGAKVPVYDLQAGGKKIAGYISKANILKAEKIMIKKERYHLGSVLREESDGITGDVWLQCVVLGEALYG